MRSSRRLADLRLETGLPPEPGFSELLEALVDIGAVSRRRFSVIPGRREYALTSPAGFELHFVARTLEGWLTNARETPLPPDGDAAKAAIEALATAYSSGLLHSLAGGPRTLKELERAASSLDPVALQHSLAALRLAELADLEPNRVVGATHTPTEWLRRAVAPLTACARWEQNHLAGLVPPVAPRDAEAALQLAVPLVRPPHDLSGSCSLAVLFDEGGGETAGGSPDGGARPGSGGLAGVLVTVEGGRVVGCAPGLGARPDASATGSVAAWLRAAIEADWGGVEFGGRERLARALLEGVNRTLFSPLLLQPQE